jgi:hypothetical protein
MTRQSAKKSRDGSRKNGKTKMALTLVDGFRKLNETTQDAELKRPPAVSDISRRYIRQDRIYTVCDTIDLGTITGSTTTNVVGALSLTLNMFYDYTSYAAVFDSFRFAYVEVTFLPEQPTASPVPQFMTVVDYDDNTTPTGVAYMIQYDTVQIQPGNTLCSRRFVPKAALAAYQGAFTGYGQSIKGQWFDTNNSNIQWYGCKYLLTVAPASSTYYRMFATVHVDFKSNK